MENREKLRKEIINYSIPYLLFLNILYYFFLEHKPAEANTIFISYSANVAFLFIFYFLLSSESIQIKISPNIVELFRLSFFFIGIAIIFMGIIVTGKMVFPIIGKIIIGSLFFSILYPAGILTLYLLYKAVKFIVSWSKELKKR